MRICSCLCKILKLFGKYERICKGFNTYAKYPNFLQLMKKVILKLGGYIIFLLLLEELYNEMALTTYNSVVRCPSI